MKKISKILSSVLAASLAFSCMAMNVMAASKAHTATITADKTTGLKAGDTVVVELTIDNTADLTSLGYTLVYDTKAFTAETTKVSKVEKCIDKEWLTEIKKEDGGSVGDYWAYYLGAPAYNVTVPGEITFSWAGGANGGIGTDDPDNEIKDNRLVGKFNLTVNENVADGEYTIGLKDDFKVCYTSDAGEAQGAQLTAATVTVKVGEDKPDEPELVANPYVFSFDADEETEVKITNSRTGDRTYSLPSFVKGASKVNALLKIKDGSDVQTGDKFTIDAIKGGKATTITTITVK